MNVLKVFWEIPTILEKKQQFFCPVEHRIYIFNIRNSILYANVWWLLESYFSFWSCNDGQENKCINMIKILNKSLDRFWSTIVLYLYAILLYHHAF